MAEFELEAINKGNTLVTIVAKDRFGNSDEVKVRVEVKVAPQPDIGPLEDITLFAGGMDFASTRVPVVIQVADAGGDENVTMTLNLDEGGEQIVSTTPSSPILFTPVDGTMQRMAEFELEAINKGNTTVTIIVRDRFGNRDEVKVRVEVKVAPNPQITEISSLTDDRQFILYKGGGAFSSTRVSVVIQAADEDEDVTLTFSLDDEGIVSTTPSSPILFTPVDGTMQRMTEFELEAINKGNTLVTIVAKDRFGNSDEVKVRVEVKVAPQPEIISPLEGMRFTLFKEGVILTSTQALVVIRATDDDGDITMKLKGGKGVVSITPDSAITIIRVNGTIQWTTGFELAAIDIGNTTVTIIASNRFENKDEVKIYVDVVRSFRDCETCPEMVVVPAGEFIMGSTSTELGRDDIDEEPQREITIPEAFAVGKYEVTRGQYAEFAASTDTIISTTWRNPGFEQTDNYPVVHVNWNDAKAYVAWLSKKTRQRCRLLSEAEWEYAARAGTTTRYFFGNATTSTLARYWHDGCGDSVDSSSPCWGTVAVGSYPANAFGLYDVHGNVWEWVEDCYHDSYKGAPTDGRVWTSNCISIHTRVVRGGAWSSRPHQLRSAIRAGVVVMYGPYDFGFRVARPIE